MLYSPLYGNIKFDEPLSRHTSIKAGGRARIWIEPESTQQLCRIVSDAGKNKIPVFTIGAGCNIIAKPGNIEKVFVRLNAPVFKNIEFKACYAVAGAGALLNNFFKAAMARSLGGYEFLSGIPGTVGGAVFGNAGTKNNDICDLLEEAEVIDRAGVIKKIKKQNIGFGYRKSGLGNYIITSAKFKFERRDKKETEALLKENFAIKKQKQDYAAPSAGCIFKNPKNFHLSAGEMIDKCGLKGRSFNGAQISSRHANFIINKHNARAEDIIFLTKLIKYKVKKAYGINLEEEVKIIS
ncbi:MAG: UDP-N-acetylmuramate dehydrogenase [Candidatus Omnitrophica bacterium]|nr:UDP-N-acetylmuramate dehydrogenase [Candidatus Omnitrophota bacterium]